MSGTVCVARERRTAVFQADYRRHAIKPWKRWFVRSHRDHLALCIVIHCSASLLNSMLCSANHQDDIDVLLASCISCPFGIFVNAYCM